MLTQIEFKNYRSLRDVTVPLADGTTLIVGDVGSGKTTLLEGLVQGLTTNNIAPDKQKEVFREKGMQIDIRYTQAFFVPTIAFDPDAVCPILVPEELQYTFSFTFKDRSGSARSHTINYTKSKERNSLWESDIQLHDDTMAVCNKYFHTQILKPATSELNQLTSNGSYRLPVIQSNGSRVGIYINFLMENHPSLLTQALEFIQIFHPEVTDIIVGQKCCSGKTRDLTSMVNRSKSNIQFLVYNTLMPPSLIHAGVMTIMCYYLAITNISAVGEKLILLDDIDMNILLVDVDTLIEKLTALAKRHKKQLLITARQTELTDSQDIKVVKLLSSPALGVYLS